MKEQIFDRVLNNLEDYALIFLNKEGNIVSWNQRAEMIKGYTEDEVRGKHFNIFYTEEDKAAGLPEKMMQTAKEKGHAQTEGWRLDKYQDKFWSKVIITAVYDNNGEVIGFVKITRDLSERMAAEKTIEAYEHDLHELTKKSQRLRSMYYTFISEIKDYAIITLDENGTIMDWNKGAEKIKGYTYEEIIGRHFSIFYPEEDKKRTLPDLLLLRAAKEGRAEHEGWRLKKDGSKFWGNVVITAIYNEKGVVRNFIKLTRDDTEKMTEQNRLKECIAALEKELAAFKQK